MLTAKQMLLLTEFVDGELSGRSRRLALLLLHQSSEARSFVRDLQENAHKLQELPIQTLPADFSQSVLKAIQDRGLRQTSTGQKSLWSRLTPWVAGAAAACLFLAVGFAIFRVGVGDSADRPHLQMALQELQLEPKLALLDAELRKATSVHLELPIRDVGAAVERLGDVLKDKGIQLLIDAKAQASLKSEEKQDAYYVYAENVRPEELSGMLSRLTEGGAKTFETVAVSTFSSEDRSKVSRMLGVDAVQLQARSKNDKDPFDLKIIEVPNEQERFAVVLGGVPGAGQVSPEVQTFLAGRRQQRAGTLQVLVVLVPGRG